MLKTIIYEKYQHEEEQYLAIVKDILENTNIVKRQVHKLWPEVMLTQIKDKRIDKNLLSKKKIS